MMERTENKWKETVTCDTQMIKSMLEMDRAVLQIPAWFKSSHNTHAPNEWVIVNCT